MKKTNPTKAQIREIVAILGAGKATSDEARKFILAYRGAPSEDTRQKARKMKAVGLDAQRCAFWEKSFPGKGMALMEILRPFYDLRILPIWWPLSDLKKRAKSAVHWRSVKGVKVLNPALLASPRISLGESLQASVQLSLGESLQASLKDSLLESFGSLFADSSRESLIFALGDSLRESFEVSLFYPCALVLADRPKEAAKFKRLLDLWIDGNFPVGFDVDGNLLILAAR